MAAAPNNPVQHVHECDRCWTTDAQAKGWKWLDAGEMGSFVMCASCLREFKPHWKTEPRQEAV
jgi:hypothetical protein